VTQFHVEIEDTVEVRHEREARDEDVRITACEVDAESEPQAIKQAWTFWEAAYGEGERPALRRITVEGIAVS
jgi:hypothetical protein